MTLLSAILRADARRPASWLSLVVAMVAVCEVAGRAGSAGAVAAWLCGAALAVAAIGAPLPDAASPLVRAGAWEGLRTAWPAAGALVGAAVRAAIPGEADGGLAARLLLFLVGAAAAMVVRRAAARAGESEADAASLALAFAGTSALAGWSVPPGRASSWLVPVTIAAAWAVQAGAVRWLDTARRPGWGMPAESPDRGARHVPSLVAPLRRGLIGGAMVLALLGMARWLLLEPRGAEIDLWVSLLAFVALAAPAATVADSRLRPSVGRVLAAGAGPSLRARGGPARRSASGGAMATEWLHAAVIAWPAIVASALLLGDRPRALAAAGIAVGVALAAAVQRGLATHRIPLGTPETRLAVSLATAVALGIAASR